MDIKCAVFSSNSQYIKCYKKIVFDYKLSLFQLVSCSTNIYCLLVWGRGVNHNLTCHESLVCCKNMWKYETMCWLNFAGAKMVMSDSKVTKTQRNKNVPGCSLTNMYLCLCAWVGSWLKKTLTGPVYKFLMTASYYCLLIPGIIPQRYLIFWMKWAEHLQ